MPKMKLYILDHGVIECDKAWLVAMNKVATVSNKNPGTDWVAVPTLTFVIDHPEGKIIYDNTCHPEGMKGRWPQFIRDSFPWYHKEEELLPNRLEKIGLTPADIQHVIISHLHMDHAGNLDLFKHAKIYVHKTELEQAFYQTNVLPEGSTAYVKSDFSIPGLQYVPVTGDMELFEGVEVIALEGHTPGILGLVLHLEKTGTILCPSDAIYSRENYGPPPKPPGIIYDTLGFFRTVEKVRKIQQRYKAQMFYAHDMDQFKNEYRLAPEYYE